MANNIIGTVGIGAASVQPDYNQNDSKAKDYIKNRPGGYVIPPTYELTWDGDVTGRETINYEQGDQTVTFVKVADEAPPIDMFKVDDEDYVYSACIGVEQAYRDGTTKTINPTVEMQEIDGGWSAANGFVNGVTSDSANINEFVTLPKGLWFMTTNGGLGQ